jgi:hypothetical protein
MQTCAFFLPWGNPRKTLDAKNEGSVKLVSESSSGSAACLTIPESAPTKTRPMRVTSSGFTLARAAGTDRQQTTGSAI